MGTVRLRVSFDDRRILSKSQKSEGLKRSWFLLKPQHETISDLSSYLTHIFNLRRSCPNGVIVSMDGFVLPPFESTCILKDKDAIRIKRKGRMSSEKVGDEANLVEEEVMRKQPMTSGMPFLASDEFEKETGSHLYESEEDEYNHPEKALLVHTSSAQHAVSRKRKAEKNLQSSKKKRKHNMVPQDIETDFLKEPNESCHNGGLHCGKSIDKKKKVSDVKSKSERTSPPKKADRNNDTVEPLPCSKRSNMLQQSGTGCVDAPHKPDGIKKVPSRSTRRKKAQRMRRRELAKAGKKELVASDLQLRRRKPPGKYMAKNAVGNQDRNENGEAEDEIAPIIIRPGHIRFEPLEEYQLVQRSQASMETFKWNGNNSKNRVQTWGIENSPSCRRKVCQDSKKLRLGTHPADFDKLAPYTSMPKKGDVIAYRLLELSSTWTPELSSFRVGKISWHNPQSNKVLLRPVPQYPITFKKKPEEDGQAQPANSLYREDKSLMISFSSLIDVRIVKHGNSDPEKGVADWGNNGQVSNVITISTLATGTNDLQTCAPTRENEVNLWDQIAEAQSAKEAQLNGQKGWGNKSFGTQVNWEKDWGDKSSGSQRDWGKGWGDKSSGSQAEWAKGWDDKISESQPHWEKGWGNKSSRAQPDSKDGWSNKSKGSGATPDGEKGWGSKSSEAQLNWEKGWGNKSSGSSKLS